MPKKHFFIKLTTLLAIILTFTYLFVACGLPLDSDTSTDTESNTETESIVESETDSCVVDSNTEADTSTEEASNTESETETNIEAETETETELNTETESLVPDTTNTDIETETDDKTESDTNVSDGTDTNVIDGTDTDVTDSTDTDVVNGTDTNIVDGTDTDITDGTDTDVVEHKHDFKFKETISHSCTENGYSIYECSCGANIADDYVEATGHSFGDWEISYLPSSSDNGSKTRICTSCEATEGEIIPKTTLYYTYSKENGENILTIESTDKALYYCYLEEPTVRGDKVDDESVDKIVFGANIVIVKSVCSFKNVKTISFSKDLEAIDDFCFYNCDIIKSLYFEGNAPKTQLHSLTLNAANTLTVIPSEDSEGFGDGLLFSGQPLYRDNVINKIPDLSLKEYAGKTAVESIELAKELIKLFNEKGQADLLLIPYTLNMEQYVEIKDFTLELTKNCTTEIEKVETIYNYITQNIVYDDNAMFYSPYEVFKYKRAVCSGYVGLMHDMLSAVDVPAFYTRGMTLFGNTETLEAILKETYTFDTHAWLSVCLSNGDVLFYDPTWGVEDNESYKSMDAEALGNHALAFEVSGLEVLIDEIDFSMLGGIHQFLHSDGKIYNTIDGVISLFSGSATINDWYIDLTEIKQSNSSEIYIDGTMQDVGTAFTNGLYYFEGLTPTYFYATANGKIYRTFVLFNYLKTQVTVYGKELSLEIGELVYDNGIVYGKNGNGELCAFAYLGDDEEITIPSSALGFDVTVVSSGFLEYNTRVKSVIVSEGITKVDRYAFTKCSSLEYVYLPSTVLDMITNQYINFTDCPNLKEIEVSSDNPYMTSLDGNLYSKDMSILLQYAPANSITTFTLPTSVVTIEENAFFEASIEKIILHDGLKKIKDNAFKYSSLKEITIPKNCEIGNSAFAFSDLRSVVIEDGIESFGTLAFYVCQNLESVALPSTLKRIPETAFGQATSLYQITIPDSVELIESGAFSYSALTSITLSSAPEIADLAFECCYKLYHINNLGSLSLNMGSTDNGSIAEHALSISDEIDSSRVSVLDGFVFYVGDEKVYLTNYIGSEKNVVLPSNFNSKEYEISEYAFVASSDYEWITFSSISIPWINELDHAGKYVESITLSKNITYIPEYAFEGWDSLTTIYFEGTEEEWQEIAINSFGNSAIINANVVFQENE